MSTLTDRLCSTADPVLAYRARLLLGGESPASPRMRTLREAIATSTMATRLLSALDRPPLHPYAKWQGAHWTLYSLAEIWFPPRREALLPLRERVLDWLLDHRFLKAPATTIYKDQPERPRRCASQEGNAVWAQVRLDLVDAERTSQLVRRLADFQWPDGGWNCDRREAARTASVQETLIPLRGLTSWWAATGDDAAYLSATRAAEFLLERRLLWRGHDGTLIEPQWGGPVDLIHYPFRFYDPLVALLGLAELGLVRDSRCSDALDLLESKRLPDGMFPVEWTNSRTADEVKSRGTYADWGARGKRRPNPFVTVDAVYVLREAGRPAD